MRKCKHGRLIAKFWSEAHPRWYSESRATGPDDPTADALVCEDCGHWLRLSPSNDEPEAVKVEVRAAELIAEANSGDWIENGCDVEDLVEAAIDIGAEWQPALKRPRSPIEMMVDRACGYTHQDPTE